MDGADVNKVILTGVLVADAELRELPRGGQVASFRLKSRSRWRDGEGQERESEGTQAIAVWGHFAEQAGHLKAGAKVLVEGRLSNRSYEGDDGVKRWVTEVSTRDVQSLGASEPAAPPAPSRSAPARRSSAPSRAPVRAPTAAPSGAAGQENFFDDDIPF